MKKLIISFLFLCFCFFAHAQLCDCVCMAEPQTNAPQERVQLSRPSQEEVESRKIAYLAAAISLTPTEAALFWPVYNDWNKKLKENIKGREAAVRKIRQLSKDKNTDERPYAQQSQILISGHAEEALIVSGAHRAYVSIIGEIRTAKLYAAEIQFRDMLLRELRQGVGEEPGKQK
jgi:hypothetical protein